MKDHQADELCCPTNSQKVVLAHFMCVIKQKVGPSLVQTLLFCTDMGPDLKIVGRSSEGLIG